MPKQERVDATHTPTPAIHVSSTPALETRPVDVTTRPILSEPSMTEPDPDSDEARNKKPWYRRCTHCWPVRKGIGYIQGTDTPEEDNALGVRHYKCDRCGLNFQRIFKIQVELVEQRRVVVVE